VFAIKRTLNTDSNYYYRYYKFATSIVKLTHSNIELETDNGMKSLKYNQVQT